MNFVDPETILTCLWTSGEMKCINEQKEHVYFNDKVTNTMDIIIGRMVPQVEGIYKCDVHGQSSDGKQEEYKTCNVTIAGMIWSILASWLFCVSVCVYVSVCVCLPL